jgi:hypothetical protein
LSSKGGVVVSAAQNVVPLIEITRSTSLRVDRDLGVVRGVKVLGLVSANGRRYTRAAIERARPLYEGIPVNIDHPHQARPDEQRRWADRLGRLENVRATDAGLFADLHYLKSHPMAEMTVEAAERMPEALGLSHNAVGRVVKRQQETIVEEIMQVRSVDVVSDPATTKSLFEEERDQGSGAGGQGAEGGGQRSEVGEERGSGVFSDRTDTSLNIPPGSLRSEKTPDPFIAELQEELAVLRRREEVRELLDAAEIPPIAPLVQALALIESSAARQALIAAWPRTARSTARLQSQSPRSEYESTVVSPRIDLSKSQEVAAFFRGM